MTVRQKDACKDGFELDKIADAVFLDLPHPWDAIPHAKKSLKQGGRLCSFSPCVEQVQKAISEMRNQGFTEISTMECLLREFQARRCHYFLLWADSAMLAGMAVIQKMLASFGSLDSAFICFYGFYDFSCSYKRNKIKCRARNWSGPPKGHFRSQLRGHAITT